MKRFLRIAVLLAVCSPVVIAHGCEYVPDTTFEVWAFYATGITMGFCSTIVWRTPRDA